MCKIEKYWHFSKRLSKNDDWTLICCQRPNFPFFGMLAFNLLNTTHILCKGHMKLQFLCIALVVHWPTRRSQSYENLYLTALFLRNVDQVFTDSLNLSLDSRMEPSSTPLWLLLGLYKYWGGSQQLHFSWVLPGLIFYVPGSECTTSLSGCCVCTIIQCIKLTFVSCNFHSMYKHHNLVASKAIWLVMNAEN